MLSRVPVALIRTFSRKAIETKDNTRKNACVKRALIRTFSRKAIETSPRHSTEWAYAIAALIRTFRRKAIETRMAKNAAKMPLPNSHSNIQPKGN